MHGVANSFLAALSALALLGIRYPLQMLPLLFFEMIWKIIWLAAIALPLWLAGSVDDATSGTIRDCLVGLIFPVIIPWRYVIANYVRKPADHWR